MDTEAKKHLYSSLSSSVTLEEKKKAVAKAELFDEYEKDPVAFMKKNPDPELIKSLQLFKNNIDSTTELVSRYL
jgi:hypothetical protein